MLTSYAQNFEDVMLWRALGAVQNGFYIDVGAQHPVIDSISLAFYEHGWRGVHVEPVPANAQALRNARPDEEVIEAAIGQSSGPITIFAIPETGLSTGQRSIADQHRDQGFPSTPVDVPSMRLSDLLERHSERDVHWLKIDVEGMERDVIESWSPSAVRPWVLCVEATRPRSPEPDFEEWEPLLLERGYIYVYFDGLNRFYVHESRKELASAFAAPPNVFDNFTLGGQANSPFANKLNADLQAIHARLQHSDAEVGRLHHHIASTDIAHAEQRGALTEKATALEQHNQALVQELESLRSSKSALEATRALDAEARAEATASVERLTAELQHSLVQFSAREQALRDEIAASGIAQAELRAGFTEKLVAARKQNQQLARNYAKLERQLADHDSKRQVGDERAGAATAALALIHVKLGEQSARHGELAAEFQAVTQQLLQQSDELKRQNANSAEMLVSLTEPGILRKSGRGVNNFVASVVAIPRRTFRFVGAHALQWLRIRPRAMAFTRRSLQKVPSLERRLLSFAADRPRSPVRFDNVWSLEPDPEALREWRRLFGLRNE